MHRRTHTTIRTAACATFVLLAACTPTTPGICERPSQQTIVFYDQSASSKADEPTRAMFRDTVEQLVSGLECPNDAVHGFLVHARTRGKVGRIEIVNRVEPLGDTTAMPSLDRAQAGIRYRKEMADLRVGGTARLDSLLGMSVSPELSAHTDLLGTLEVISDEVSRADSGSTFRVVYLGDMHESMPPPRRNFDAQPPGSSSEAQAWADADTAVLRGMNVDRARLGKVEVRVLLGGFGNREGAPEIRAYWERLFRNAGIVKVQYN